MVKETFKISDLSIAIDEKDNDKTLQTASSSSARKTVSSPINSPAVAQKSDRIQRLYIDLPVSKERVECDLIEIDPDDCVVSPLNKRIQSLLSPNDPAIQTLKNNILNDKQRDPVLLRPLTNFEGSKKYELIYGSRRRYSVKLLRNEGHEDIKLKAWIAPNMTDLDAKRLADSENDDRQEISSWELAKYYEKLRESNPALTAEVIAVNEQSTASTIRRYLQLASLPEHIVKKVATPTEISLRAGLDILKYLNTLSKSERSDVEKALDDQEIFLTAKDLLKSIKDITSSPRHITRKKPLYIQGKNGERKAAIGAHRTIPNQYKIDLFGVSEDDIQRVVQSLELIVKR
ncbi:ParB/RepB/Spo0J family partition protein [Sessilibacter corallicola]|uniref:ParB/RepB/Spo0J family partition protein n=1 Tax=Sessilibacter corallicola TaxID=2904075 RepID=UPI001E3E1797|nr:ParB/RepB/Spo0J family partition protein [Sessilibacter corallicola]MCE2030325.1 ParB/RepB/Spo0J family partition protein [Sessilibacter corallicola]